MGEWELCTLLIRRWRSPDISEVTTFHDVELFEQGGQRVPGAHGGCAAGSRVTVQLT